MATKDATLLVHQGLAKALNGRDALLGTMFDANKYNIMEKAHSAILVCLGDEVLREVSKETTAVGLWLKLETLYMKNKLYTVTPQIS